MVESEPILTRISAGDLKAVQDCQDRYAGLVWSLARRLLRNCADLEDAVQEVFIDLWKSAGRFNPDAGSETTFVATIARRRLIDFRRRRMRQPETGPMVSLEAFDVPDEAPDSSALELLEEASRAQAAVRALRPDQQAVLRLAVYEGWSHQQIAESLQMPLGTVKTHVRRGLSRVRELLGHSGHAQPSGSGQSVAGPQSGSEHPTSAQERIDSSSSAQKGSVRCKNQRNI